MLPLTITNPGTYEFAGDLTYAGPEPITIMASNVDLEGNGHALSGTGSDGIASPLGDNVTINGVTVSGFDTDFNVTGGHGVTLSADTAQNGRVGFLVRANLETNLGGFRMSGDTASGNSLTGIHISVTAITSSSGSPAGALAVSNSTASNNGTLGQLQSGGILIDVPPARVENLSQQTLVTLSGDRANGNNGFGLDLEGSNGDPQFASLYSSVTAITVSGNAGSGILINDSHGTVTRNTATSNGATGIEAGGNTLGSLFTSNKASGNAPDLSQDDSCAGAWANNSFTSDNEIDINEGPKYGCIR